MGRTYSFLALIERPDWPQSGRHLGAPRQPDRPEAALIAFDLLKLDGDDLRPVRIEVRKQKLAKLVRNAGAGNV
jgi:hypothetical protein